MFLLCLFVVCLAVVGLLMLVHAAYSAPEGVEDESGFYLTASGESSESAMPRHALLTASDLVFLKQ